MMYVHEPRPGFSFYGEISTVHFHAIFVTYDEVGGKCKVGVPFFSVDPMQFLNLVVLPMVREVRLFMCAFDCEVL